jgi:predicted regulator of Ras-like GTPase activity (Roadblock/LC7/MglB family)
MTAGTDMTWLLDDLTARVPELDRVVMLSRDGLAISSSSFMSKEDAERLAAIAAGFYSLARGSAASLGGDQTRHIIVEMTGRLLFVAAAGPDGCIAAVAGTGARLSVVAYEVTLLARRVATHMPGPRRAFLGGGMR